MEVVSRSKNLKPMPKRNKQGEYVFDDCPEFRPNLSPKEMFSELGSFGGTYWRPIYSSKMGQNYKNVHLTSDYPEDWWVPVSKRLGRKNHLTKSWQNYDTSINYYGVKCGRRKTGLVNIIRMAGCIGTAITSSEKGAQTIIDRSADGRGWLVTRDDFDGG